MNEMIIVYGEVERTWKEAVVFYFYTLFLYLLGGSEETIISALARSLRKYPSKANDGHHCLN
jgi:hypothetical protein